MRGNKRHAGRERTRARDHGRDIGAAFGHASGGSLVSRASAASALAPAERDPAQESWRATSIGTMIGLVAPGPALSSRSALARPGHQRRAHATQAAKPSLIFASGSLRPMKMMRLSRFSPGCQGRWWSPSRIMCTPWNTNRSLSSLNDKIGLIEQDDVGERDLVLRLRRVLEPVPEPFGVGDGDNGVELGFAADIVVDEERLRHWRGVREPRGLEDDGVEFALPAHQPVNDAHEIAAHRAADAAVVHLEDFFVGADDEIDVDVNLAELVDDDSVLLPVRLRQEAVEQRRLAGAEIAGEHGDGDLIGHSHELRLAPYIYIRQRMPSCRSTRHEPPNVDLSATPFLQIKVMRSSNRA